VVLAGVDDAVIHAAALALPDHRSHLDDLRTGTEDVVYGHGSLLPLVFNNMDDLTILSCVLAIRSTTKGKERTEDSTETEKRKLPTVNSRGPILNLNPQRSLVRHLASFLSLIEVRLYPANELAGISPAFVLKICSYLKDTSIAPHL